MSKFPNTIIHPKNASVTVQYNSKYSTSGTSTHIDMESDDFKEAISKIIRIRPDEQINGFEIQPNGRMRVSVSFKG